MGVQAVENMVKKYARQVTPNKKITPHKLRSTYGTSLYKETGDIYLVADVLGHKDVNTSQSVSYFNCLLIGTIKNLLHYAEQLMQINYEKYKM